MLWFSVHYSYSKHVHEANDLCDTTLFNTIRSLAIYVIITFTSIFPIYLCTTSMPYASPYSSLPVIGESLATSEQTWYR